MKRSLFAMAAVLSGIFFLLSWVDRNGLYVAEQHFWSVNKKLTQLARDPKAAPDQVYDLLEKDYEKIIKRFPQSILTDRARLMIGQIYWIKNDWGTARNKWLAIVQNHPAEKSLCAQALEGVAKTYEAEGKWELSEGVYRQIIKDYGTTEVGWKAPLQLVAQYQQRGQTSEAQTALQEAMAHYRQQARTHMGTEEELSALRMLANAYLLKEDWQSLSRHQAPSNL